MIPILYYLKFTKEMFRNEMDIDLCDDNKTFVYNDSNKSFADDHAFANCHHLNDICIRFLHIPPSKKEIDARKIIIFKSTKFPNVLLYIYILIEYLQLDHNLIYHSRKNV